MTRSGVGHAGGGEEAREDVFPEVAGIQASRANRFQRGPSGGGDLGSGAVGERYGQVKPGVQLGIAFGCLQVFLDVGIEPDAVANETQAYPGLLQLGDFRPEIAAQKSGQIQYLTGGATPVLTAESVDGQPGNAGFDCRFNRATDGAGAFPMPGDTRQAAGFGPAPVAVHDDGDMLGHYLFGRADVS